MLLELFFLEIVVWKREQQCWTCSVTWRNSRSIVRSYWKGTRNCVINKKKRNFFLTKKRPEKNVKKTRSIVQKIWKAEKVTRSTLLGSNKVLQISYSVRSPNRNFLCWSTLISMSRARMWLVMVFGLYEFNILLFSDRGLEGGCSQSILLHSNIDITNKI